MVIDNFYEYKIHKADISAAVESAVRDAAAELSSQRNADYEADCMEL